MPTQKDLKRLVRARMKKTGERYTTARAQLLKKSPAPRRAATKAPAPIAGDLAALAGMSDASVAKKTGRTWKEWVLELDKAGAAKLSHGEIAKLVHGLDVPDWWAQMVTVGYERIRGLRQRSQRRDGTFEVSKSKVYPVPIEELWKGFLRCKIWLEGETLRMSKATKHKYMHMRWKDGTPVDAGFYAKGPAKSHVAVAHRKIATRAEAERLRTFWGERLVALGALLAEKR